MPEPKAVPASEAAAILGLTPAGLKGLRMQGRGPTPIKLGGTKQARVIYKLADLDAWLANPSAYEAKHRRRHRGRTSK